MNESNISRIEPSEQFSPYLDISSNREKEAVVYDSAIFANLYYGKRSLKEFLEERNEICQQLNLSSKNGSKKPILNELIRSQLISNLLEMFAECPSKLDYYSFSLVENYKTIFIFFSCEDKLVPLCKWCNRSVYITIREQQGRIVCSSHRCKKKILGEFEIVLKEKK